MIGLADKCAQERKRDVNGRLMNHERRLLSTAVKFKSIVQLSSLDDGVAATPEAFRDKCPNRSPGVVVISGPIVAGDNKGDSDFRYMPSDSSFGREQRRTVLSNIQGLVICAGFPAPDSGLDVLRTAECSLHDGLTLMELRRMLANEWAEAESKMAETRRFGERLHADEEDSEAIREARVRVDDLTAECV